MLEYSHIDSSIKKIIGMASHLKRWPLYVHDPISTWVRGRVVLIGDAVHPVRFSFSSCTKKNVLTLGMP